MFILSDDFKNKAEEIIGGEISLCHVSLSNNDVSMEQIQDALLDMLERVKNGEGIVLDRWPDNTPKKSLSEILNEVLNESALI